jgi:hypothetical protein
MKLTRCHPRPSWALVGAAALAVLLIASPETLAERSRGRGHERGNGRGHGERARGGGNGHGYGHERTQGNDHGDRRGRDRVEASRPQRVRGAARYGHRPEYRSHRDHGVRDHRHTSYRTYRPRPYVAPWRHHYLPYRSPFVVPVRIASVYEFPVHSSAGYVVRPHYYCEGELYRGNHVAYSDGRLSVAIRF